MDAVVNLADYRRKRWSALLPVDGPCVAVMSDGTRWEVAALFDTGSALCARLEADGTMVRGSVQAIPCTMLRKAPTQ